jgi:hypothetical protein
MRTPGQTFMRQRSHTAGCEEPCPQAPAVIRLRLGARRPLAAIALWTAAMSKPLRNCRARRSRPWPSQFVRFGRIDAVFYIRKTLTAAQRVEARIEPHPAQQHRMFANRAR